MTRAPRPRAAALGVLLATLAGCGQRGTEPPVGPGGLLVAGVAVVLVSAVLGVVITLPVWRSPHRGSRVATAVLALQTGGAAVATVVLSAMAVRSYQLHDRPAEEAAAEPVTSGIIRLGTIDGDTELFALLTLFVVLAGLLLVTALAVGTRLAASDDELSRWVVTGLLGLQLLVAGTTLAAGWLVLEEPVLVRWSLVALPVLGVAFVAAWPREEPSQA